MRLLKTYSDDASMHGYLDPASGILYHVETATAWLTETGRPSRVAASTADAIHFLSPPFYSEAEALAELDRIAALIEGKHEPRWGIGIDLASGPDFAVDVVIDRATGKIVSVKDVVTPAQGWVAGAPPLVDGKWFLAMHQGEPVAVHCHAPNDLPWTDSAGNDYPSSEFTHHLPTPIQPPKES